MSTGVINVLAYTHEWLWGILEHDPVFAEHVPPVSREKMLTFFVPEALPTLAEADSPHVSITLSKTEFGQGVASNTSLVTLYYDIHIYVAGLNLEPAMDVAWAILGALVRGRANVTPKDPYIYDARILDGKHEVVRSGRVSVLSVCGVAVSVSVASTSLDI